MCVCTRACVYAYVFISVCICMGEYACVCVYVYVYVCMHMYLFLCVYAWTHISIDEDPGRKAEARVCDVVAIQSWLRRPRRVASSSLTRLPLKMFIMEESKEAPRSKTGSRRGRQGRELVPYWAGLEGSA